MSPKSLKYIFVLMFSIFLPACAFQVPPDGYASQGEWDAGGAPNLPKVDSYTAVADTAGPVAGSALVPNQNTDQDIQYSQDIPPGSDKESYYQYARHASNSDVEIFRLGDVMPQSRISDTGMSPLPPVASDPVYEVKSAIDSNVLVYPVVPQDSSELYRQQGKLAGPLASGMNVVNGGLSYVASGGPSVLFADGSSQLDSDGKALVSSVAEQYKGGAGSITVEGHASKGSGRGDPAQEDISNLKVSMDRAYEVSKNLIKSGVPVEAITTTAYGDARAVPGADAQSRRVNILQGKSGLPWYETQIPTDVLNAGGAPAALGPN